MKRLIVGLLAVCLGSLAYAQTEFETANAAYAEGRYADAAALYQSIIDDPFLCEKPLNEKSLATVYYNLGNAQFKQGELAQAILAYERALRLRPHYPDAQYNLAFAQSRITDNIKEQDFFLSVWARSIRNSAGETTWLICSIVLFAVALVALLLFLLGRELWLRKSAFHIAWLALLFSIITGLNAGSLHLRDTQRAEAVITQGVVNAKSSPDRSGTDLFTLHEGTKVIIRETIGEWANVRVGGNEGWIRLQYMERI